MADSKGVQDENRRLEPLDSGKAQVAGEIKAELAEQVEVGPPADVQEIEPMAGQFRNQALNEMLDTEFEVVLSRNISRISQGLNYLFCIIYGLLGVRFLLALVETRSGDGFVHFIHAITDPLYAPFRGILDSPSVIRFTLVLPILVALIVYMLLHAGANGFLRFLAHRKTEI